jgi:hypothetical protein
MSIINKRRLKFDENGKISLKEVAYTKRDKEGKMRTFTRLELA